MNDLTLHCGDCLDVMAGMEPNSIDAIVTDPPYGLFFMGKDWDHGIPGIAFWVEVLRVAKPGAMLLAFGGTRTFHRLTVAIEDAGWEIRDCLMWLYGSGFPKSHNISKAIDKTAGAEQEVVGRYQLPDGKEWNLQHDNGGGFVSKGHMSRAESLNITAPATDAAKQWDGWGTALKPAWEPVILARKPFPGTVAANVLKWGTGAINIDASRIPIDPKVDDQRLGGNGTWGTDKMAKNVYEGGYAGVRTGSSTLGRWPANLILDEEMTRLLDEQTGELHPRGNANGTKHGQAFFRNCDSQYTENNYQYPGGSGASRFFYCAKASRTDRDGSIHPTMKPITLMRYLVRLITPPGGIVLDPFMGSGSTGKAVMLEEFRFIGCEIDPDYFAIAERRIADAQARPPLIPHANQLLLRKGKHEVSGERKGSASPAP